ncbi:MAG: hypothetical protein IPP72_04545 [Chitinophagaceae bacterium]|nr:hypothetical protein [Chitinophagaceae bacterium]
MPQDKQINHPVKMIVVNDDAAAYEQLDKKRRIGAILSSDTDKFRLFTKLMRIPRMMKNAKIISLNP